MQYSNYSKYPLKAAIVQTPVVVYKLTYWTSTTHQHKSRRNVSPGRIPTIRN